MLRRVRGYFAYREADDRHSAAREIETRGFATAVKCVRALRDRGIGRRNQPSL